MLNLSINLNKNRTLAIFFVIAQWVVYVLSVVGLHQLEKINIMGPDKRIVAAAVSYAYFHVPFGKGINEVTDILQRNNVGDGIKEIRDQGIKQKHIKDIGSDGEASFALEMMCNLGMKLFGVNTHAIFLFFSLFILISHLAFAWRFHDARFIFAPIILFSLTLMLFTPLVRNDDIASQIAIGMFRYFTLLGMLPVIHVLLELLDSQKRLNLSMSICLIIQVIIIGLCGFEAKSSAYIFVSIFIFSTTTYFFFLRKNQETSKLFLSKIKNILLTLILFSICFYAIVPRAYIEDHRLTDDFWHRIWISYGSNPTWPFKEINEQYAGCIIKSGLKDTDSNGECAWVRYAKKHHLDPKGKYPYMLTYEIAARDAFFETALNYPMYTLETFLYYKPINIISNLRYDLHYRHLLKHTRDFIYLIFSLFILILSWLFYFSKENFSKNIFFQLGLIILLILSTNTMYIVAWANPFVIAELVLITHIFVIFSLMISANFVKVVLNKLRY